MDSLTRTSRGDAFTELLLETFRFNGQLIAAGNSLTADLGITSALWQVMGALKVGPLPMARIARSMGLTRQSVRRSVNLLQNKGLVGFRDNPEHKRAMLVELTEQGAAILHEVSRRQVEWANAVAKGMDEEQMIMAAKVMRLLGNKL